jgi:hypothetical protein
VTGNFQLSNAAGGNLLFNRSASVPGSIEIGGALTLADATLSLQINGTLTLAAAGVLNNPGTVRVGEFVNNGGTINGNPPIILFGGPGLQVLRIDRIEAIEREPAPIQRQSLAPPDKIAEAMILWSAEPGRRFDIQISHDLVHWHAHEVQILESSPGRYEAYFNVPRSQPCYFRLRSADF